MRGFGIVVKFGCHSQTSVAMQSKAKLNNLLTTFQRKRLNSNALIIILKFHKVCCQYYIKSRVRRGGEGRGGERREFLVLYQKFR